MTAPYTYNQLINWFNSFATNHYQIHHFGYGDLWEAMKSNQPTHKLYPVLWINPTSSTIEFPFLKTKFQILCMDLVNPDESNEAEVLSDMQGVMADLKTYLLAPAYQNLFWVEKASTITPFTEKFSDKVSGWMMDVEIKVKWQKDNCAVPISGAPSGDNVCRPVIIYDSNGGVIATVASGGSYIITNAGFATVENSDQTFQEQIASGATEVLDDTTYNLNINGVLYATVTVPSMVDETFNINIV